MDVTGLPETEKMPGKDSPTDVTVPVPDSETQVRCPEPSVVKTWLFMPFVLGSWNNTLPAAAGTLIVADPDAEPFRTREPPVPPLRPNDGAAVATHAEKVRLSTVPCPEPKPRSSRVDCG
jgi:hypothetical protein